MFACHVTLCMSNLAQGHPAHFGKSDINDIKECDVLFIFSHYLWSMLHHPTYGSSLMHMMTLSMHAASHTSPHPCLKDNQASLWGSNISVLSYSY
jgi:hypothetical protein